MDILLWRHAEAEDGSDDLLRALTPKGQEQAATMARWIRRHGPEPLTVLVSPAQRARETAAPLGCPVQLREELAPGHGAGELIQTCLDEGGPDGASRAILVVGHQPTLGQAAACWMTGHHSDWNIKKGALWWLVLTGRPDAPQVHLKAVMEPRLAAR